MLLTEVRGIGRSPSLAPSNWGKQVDRRRGADRSESTEDDPAPRVLQVIPPSDRGEVPPSRSEYMWSGLPRPKRSNQVITNNYLPPRGPEPQRVEISAPGEEEVKEILRRWEPFHLGASAADRLNSLYPAMYRVPMAARGMGFHEDYTVPVLASTLKKDFLEIIDDGIQVRNHNFVQSIELVRYVVPLGGFSAITYLFNR